MPIFNAHPPTKKKNTQPSLTSTQRTKGISNKDRAGKQPTQLGTRHTRNPSTFQPNLESLTQITIRRCRTLHVIGHLSLIARSIRIVIRHIHNIHDQIIVDLCILLLNIRIDAGILTRSWIWDRVGALLHFLAVVVHQSVRVRDDGFEHCGHAFSGLAWYVTVAAVGDKAGAVADGEGLGAIAVRVADCLVDGREHFLCSEVSWHGDIVACYLEVEVDFSLGRGLGDWWWRGRGGGRCIVVAVVYHVAGIAVRIGVD